MSTPYRPPVAGYGRPHPQGSLVLVLGVLGLALCPVAVLGLRLGHQALREIDANPHAYSNRPAVVVGRALSVVSLAAWSVVVVVYLVAVVALGLPGRTS